MRMMMTVMATFSLSGAAYAQAEATAYRDALAQMSGAWEGVLEYRDYQSNQLEGIPLATVMFMPGDLSYAMMRSEFTDPGFQVYAVSITQFNGDELSAAYFRDGERDESEARVAQFERTAAGWTAVVMSAEPDDDILSEIRMTHSFDGEEYRVVKEVRSLGSDDAFAFRNQVRLSRAD